MMAESDELVSFRNSDDKTLAKMFKVESKIKELTKVYNVHHQNSTDYCHKCKENCCNTTYSSTNFREISHDK